MGWGVYQSGNYVYAAYTYTDQDDEPIDLTGWGNLTLRVYHEDDGTLAEITDAVAFDADRTTGLVTGTVKDTPAGTITLQFYCDRPDGLDTEPLYGTPHQFVAAPNAGD